MTTTTIKPYPEHDGDRHLRPAAYYALALLAGTIGLSASYVTVQLFALAIQATEQEGMARELLTLTAALFVAAELAAMFVAGLVPVRRLRALRWQLIACAAALVAFEAVSLYGARVALAQSADARADAGAGRVEQLRASIEANRSSAAALVAAGQRSSQSAIASSRADGAQSIRDAAALEADTRRMAAELAQLQAARAPTATTVFGESGVIALSVAQSLLISCIGLLFIGAAGVLARAARDAQGTAQAAALPAQVAALATDAPDAPDAPTAKTDALPSRTDASTDAVPVAAAALAPAAPVRQAMRVAVEQTQATPRGTAAAVPSWRRYTLPALAAGAGLATLGASLAHAEPMQTPARSADALAGHVDALVIDAAALPAQVAALATDAPDASTAKTDASTDAVPVAAAALVPDAVDAPQAGTDAPTTAPVDALADAPMQAAALVDAPTDDGARFLRVKAGIEAGRIKPSLRAIYAAEGASQEVARRYLVELEQAGVIERAGRGYRLTTQEGGQA
ncbi:hypothetical protein [Malikia sp.]|uniref:hypothetical protein n=1 Tax=Malikia sp. TaxID=2070706 RepID=UPI002602338B|nr:hypothetical protein [Malikia sp.]MDD2729298.1 hypothetical protein [Malikia sp.]